ncbi:MAG: hypothetical protein Q9169_003037 [Polycauliona sp. 2 TL-2023]
MPLHLLGKKSWNVYNQDNIEKVKRDEAAAAAREAAEEQRMQEVDAERRIKVLRGVQHHQAVEEPAAAEQVPHQDVSHKKERKRRKLAGEDDTDRDLRYAKEDRAAVMPKHELQLISKKSSDAPLIDRQGHINLFPMDGSRHHAPKNAEVEAEKAKKKKEYEDQYTMRFSNAAGFKQSIGDKPWYQSSAGVTEDSNEISSKDVWGNEDPRRREREKMRVAADDPMASMQKGVSQLRQVEKERKQWLQEKQQETEELAEIERRRNRRQKRKHKDGEIEGFSLDASVDAHGRDEGLRARHRHQHRHKHQSRSKEDGQDRVSREKPSRDPNHERRYHKGSRSAVTIDDGWRPGSGGRYSDQFAHAFHEA